MDTPILPPEFRPRTVGGVEISVIRPMQPVVQIKAAPRAEKPEHEMADEPPPRYDVYNFAFARQIAIATSSGVINARTSVDGRTVIFRQTPAVQGMPYTYVYFGTSGPSTSTG
jgi:hypothetical protein